MVVGDELGGFLPSAVLSFEDPKMLKEESLCRASAMASSLGRSRCRVMSRLCKYDVKWSVEGEDVVGL